MIYLLTAIVLTPGGSSTVHIYTQTIHRTIKLIQNTQNGTYITIRIHKIKNTLFTILNRSLQYIQLYIPLLTLILPTWNIGWSLNNASKWQMGFNLAFKGLKIATERT
jgi:hypothetical protein